MQLNLAIHPRASPSFIPGMQSLHPLIELEFRQKLALYIEHMAVARAVVRWHLGASRQGASGFMKFADNGVKKVTGFNC